MTPAEALRTMTRDMVADVVRFKHAGADAVEDMRPLEDRGIVGVDENDSPVLTAHGVKVFHLIAKRGIA